MLHLLPIRYVLAAIIFLVAIAVLAAVYAGAVGDGDALSDIILLIRYSLGAASILFFVPYLAWRWLKPLQHFIFPYLGGQWAGDLQFEGANGKGSREISLSIRQTPLRIVLILESAEAISRTLVVHAERDKEINSDKLYYIYLNERKEGTIGARDRYRGTAVLRADFDGTPSLHGDFFTENDSKGTLELKLQKQHKWWEVWK